MSDPRTRQDIACLPYQLQEETLSLLSAKVREILQLASDAGSRSQAEAVLRDELFEAAQGQSLAEAIISAIGAGLTVQDREFRVVYQNSIMKRLFGSRVGERCYAAYASNEATCQDCSVAACFSDGETHASERSVSLNGATAVLENVASPLRDATGAIVAAVEVVRDITDRKITEHKLTRLSNLYQALSHTNKAILRTKDRDELFQEICRVAVTYGRFCLVWIGILNHDSGFLRPVARSGLAQGYLELLQVSIDESREDGQGPTGIAIRRKTPYICNDYLADPHTSLWHEAARAHGIAASAAFPLEQQGGDVGALKVYSQEKGFFDEEMVSLLQEMAANISFAMDNFAREEQRKKTQTALSESEERLQLVLEGSRDAFWDWDVATGAFKMSDRYFGMLGFEVGEIEATAAAVRTLVHPDDCLALTQTLEEHLAGLTLAYEMEFRMATKTGAWVWVLERGKVVARDHCGTPLRVAGTSSDITERKYFEENLRYVSTHDSMTGLFNRAYFDAEFDRIALSRHYPISIVIADVDGLKHVNDSFGHTEGDRLIKQAAQALREAFRAEDVIARIGGDEFAVILPDTDANAVKEAVQRVREFQERINQSNSDYTLSLSIGSATASQSSELVATLKLADSRMYYYKFQRKSREH